MCRLAKDLKLANLLVRSCLLLTLWIGVYCRDSSNGGRKVLGLTASSTSKNDVKQMFSLPSFVCRIVTETEDTKYCLGALVSSRWLLIASSCAPNDLTLSRNHVRVVCGSPSSSPELIQNEFDVVEVKPLRSLTTGQRQEPDIALLKLDTDAPGPFVKFEESNGPDVDSLELKEVLNTFLKDPDLAKVQTQDSWQNEHIDIIGLPLIMKSSAMKNGDASENSLHQITACCLATACQLVGDGVRKCTYSRITPLERKTICRITGTCNDVPSASSMPPSFHRSLSESPPKDACLDSHRPVLLAERRLIPPFAPLFCSDDIKAQLQSMSSDQWMSRLKRQVNIDDATDVKRSLTCSNFSINTLDKHNETFLHDAAWHNSNRSAKVLCELNIDTEVKNKQGKTALLVAADHTSFETLNILLNYNANVNASDNKGRTALHFAAMHNSTNIAQTLCDHDIYLDAQDKEGRTALYHTVKNCDTETADILVENEADPSIKDHKGETPLDLISKSPDACDKDTVEHLRSILSHS